MTTQTITLKPDLSYWFVKSITLVVLLCAIIVVVLFVPLPSFIKLLCLIFFFTISATLFYSYFKITFCTKWEITSEQLFVYEGVFIRNIDFVELYRVVDYKVQTDFFQSWFGLHNLYVLTNDQTKPTIHIFGIKDKSILQEIRDRVEQQRITKNVREFTHLNF